MAATARCVDFNRLLNNTLQKIGTLAGNNTVWREGCRMKLCGRRRLSVAPFQVVGGRAAGEGGYFQANLLRRVPRKQVFGRLGNGDSVW